MSLVRVNTRKSRAATNAVLDLVEQGALDKESLIRDLLNWMSEDEVREFCEKNLQDSIQLDD